MIYKDNIYKRIADMNRESLNIRDIEKRLNLRSQIDRNMLSRILSELEDEGMLSIDRNWNVKLKKLKLLKGDLRGNKRGFAFLIREDGGEDIFIPNRALNGAMHGDTVFVRLTGESEGEVSSIEKRGIVKLIGTYFKMDNFGYVKADNSDYFKDIYIPDRSSKGAKDNSKVVVSIITNQNDMKIQGVVTEVLGISGERDAEVLSILRNYDFSEKFPEEVLAASEKLKYEPENEGRKDKRDLLTITIDGEDAKDFDDAISLEKNCSIFKLYVHIADVSHYVRSGDVIDKEAFERGTSVYFPSSVFPMLPEAVSNGVCSLRPGEEKLTMTVELDIDGNGNIINSDFYKSVTKSNFRMTYTAVTAILNGDEELRAHYSEIEELIYAMAELAKILEDKRNEGGAINFVSKESKILLDEKGDVIDIKPYAYGISNSVIEQFMVLANEAVAKYLYDEKVPNVYRTHDAPSETKIAEFKEFVNALGLNLNTALGVTPKLFSDLLEKVKGEPTEAIINKTLLRAMQKAKYSIKNTGHFGLNSQFYCHFTSPIRRYPDLMVHRALKAKIEGKADDRFKNNFLKQCISAADKSSEREVAAERAERDIDDYYKTVYMSKKIGEQYSGVVSGIVSTGIFIALENTVEGFMPLDELPEDNYSTDPKMRLVGKRYQFSIGDSIEVEIKSTNIAARQINMSFIGNVLNHRRPSIRTTKKLI
ncbi:MAG: ribonuclease R [Clostridia bacterium]|nr:ribonuclease R [Clostridia bacterium]